MNLTLEHLAKRLPYGVKGYYCGHGKPCKDASLTAILYAHPNGWEIAVRLEGERGFGEYDSDVLFYFKPYLHPLSDLTKTITHKGEEFVPIEEIDSLFTHLHPYNDDQSPLLFAEWIIHKLTDPNDNPDDAPNGIIKWLYKHHFDTDNLIAAGLAIDVNTLDKNPYA